METNVLMPNDTHEILFLVANEFLTLNHMQKMQIGIKLKLIDFGGFCRTEKAIEEMVFANAYKKNMISNLVAEIQKVTHATSKQD